MCMCVAAYGPAGVLFHRDAFKCVRVCYQLVLCFTPVVIRMCVRERGEDRRREIRGEDKRIREINKLPFNAYIIASFLCCFSVKGREKGDKSTCGQDIYMKILFNTTVSQ